MGYDFSVEYKPGRHHIVADGLFRRETTEPSLNALSEIQFLIFNQLKEEASTNVEATKIVAAITKGHLSPSWKLEDGLILYKRRVHVPASSRFFTIYFMLFMMLLMKDQKKHSIDSDWLFTLPKLSRQFNNSSVIA